MGCKKSKPINKYSETPRNKQITPVQKSNVTNFNRALLQRASTPIDIPTDQITTVYKLPTEEYRTIKDVIIGHGFIMENIIGCGAYAVVYKAKRIDTNEPVACKIVNLMHNDKRRKHTTEAKNELFILEKIRHPHIVKLFEHFIINKDLYIFMEFASGGSLSVLIRTKGPVKQELCRKWFSQILSAVKYMHSHGIAHRDLKLGNILIDDHNNMIVADFGLSRVSYRESQGGVIFSRTYCGTEPYMAPEILKKPRNYDPFPADVWALGVILYAMVNRGFPFHPGDKERMLKLQLARKWKFNKKLQLNQYTHVIDVLQKCFDPNPVTRIKLIDLAKHKWISEELMNVISEVSVFESIK